MERRSIEPTKQSRGYQPGKRVGQQLGTEYRTGTIIEIEFNLNGQEEALVRFDDDESNPVLILTVQLALI